MPFVKAMCTNCGGILQVDDSKDAAICPFCQTPYIVEKAINNYQITNQYKIENSNVYINNGLSIEQKIENAEAFISVHHDYDKAETLFKEASEMAPMDYRTWWGIVRAQTGEFAYFGFDNDELDEVREYMTSAIKVAGDKKDAIIKKWDKYMSDYNTLIDLDARRKILKDKMYIAKLNQPIGFRSIRKIIGVILIILGIIILPPSIQKGKVSEVIFAVIILCFVGGFLIVYDLQKAKLTNDEYNNAKDELDKIVKKMAEVDPNNTWFD
ncbi:MAG: hypothetical protein IK014_00555 [Lachnospiraceae bacterium]|nr:hypothetical protein [Lachnospiraceae bacterium]